MKKTIQKKKTTQVKDHTNKAKEQLKNQSKQTLYLLSVNYTCRCMAESPRPVGLYDSKTVASAAWKTFQKEEELEDEVEIDATITQIVVNATAKNALVDYPA